MSVTVRLADAVTVDLHTDAEFQFDMMGMLLKQAQVAAHTLWNTLDDVEQEVQT